MAQIKFVDFLESTELKREKLIDCVSSNGHKLDKSTSLAQTIDTTCALIDSGEITLDDGYFINIVDGYTGDVIEFKDGFVDGDVFTLPTPPDHTDEGWRFVEWVCSQDLDAGGNSVTFNENNIALGAYYRPINDDGLNYLFIEVNKATGLTGTIRTLARNSSTPTVIDWGDGNTTSVTSTSIANYTHTYENYGKYIIKLPDYSLQYTISSASLFGSVQSNWRYYACYNIIFSTTIPSIGGYICNQFYSLKSVIFPRVNAINSSAFTACYSLNWVIIPNGVGHIGTYCFQNCRTLVAVVLPTSVQIIETAAFSGNYKIQSIIIPSNVTTLYSSFSNNASLKFIVFQKNSKMQTLYSSFDTNYQLSSIVIPSGVYLLNNTFNYCYNLKSIALPTTITTILTPFTNCYNLQELDFSAFTKIPALTGTWSSITASLKIIVPDALYDEWIVATNWAAIANNIYKVSEVINND